MLEKICEETTSQKLRTIRQVRENVVQKLKAVLSLLIIWLTTTRGESCPD